MDKRIFIALAIILASVSFFLFNSFYKEAENTAIAKLNEEQTIHARQAARGIEDFFAAWTRSLNTLSKMDAIIDNDAVGKRYMKLFYEANQEQIRSITRLDERGVMLYNVPSIRAVGTDISGQKHVHELLRDHKPVISDVFRAVEGFEAIALHVPVFKRTVFKGSIGILIDFESLAKRYLDVIKIGETGYAWVVSRDGTVLYGPIPGGIGKSVYETIKEFPSLIVMANDMLKGHEGTTTYTFDRIGDRNVGQTRKYAVYMPVHLGNTFWSVAVASAEQDVLSGLISFRNKLVFVIGAIFICGMVFSIYGTKAWLIVNEEEKRRKIENELRKSEERLRLVLEANSEGVWDWNIPSGHAVFSPRYSGMLGYEPDEFPKSYASWKELVHPDDFQRVNTAHAEHINEGKEFRVELRMRKKSGDWCWILSRGMLVERDAEGRAVRMVGTHLDITNRKQIEKELVESEGRLRDITFSMADWVWEVDEKGVYTYTSAKGTELFGSVIGKTPFDFMLPDEAKRVAGIFSEIAANKKPIKDLENWNTGKDGKRICLLTNGVPILDEEGNLKGYRGVDKDITDRKRAEAALEESRAQITAVMNSTNDFIWSVDPERFGLLTWNRAFRDYFFEQRGIELEVGMTPAELVPPDYVPLWHRLFSRALREEFVIVEYVVVAQTRTLLLSLHTMRRDHGAFGISVFGRDITELKQAEEELLAEKNKLQAILSAINSGITIRNPDYDLIYQNDYSLNTFGNHIGDKCYRAFAGIDRVCDDCPVEKAFQDGKSHSYVKEVEILPGEITFWENTAVPMKDSNESIYACLEINNNITERKKSEKLLIENEAALRNSQKDLQKLAGRLISAQEEELRRLSRELHDDLTQRLAVLAIDAGKLELDLGKQPEACPEISQTISQMKEQLIRVSEDVHNISRQLHPTILDDLGLVRAIESECAALMRRENIEIIFNKEDVPAEIDNDIALCLYRVLQESLKNVISHSLATSCEIFLKGADNMLCLTISDNGVGFEPAEVRNKAGLGLSSMRERAQLIQGDFSIKSRPGQGTVIRIGVPLKVGDV